MDMMDVSASRSLPSHVFMGRSKEQQSIKEHILNFLRDLAGNTFQVIQITGPHVIGKTSLAKRVARDVQIECMKFGLPLKSHLIDLQKETRIANVFRYLSRELNCSSLHETGTKLLCELSSRNRNHDCMPTCNSHDLIVLDGIEDLLATEESCEKFLIFCEQMVSKCPALPLFFIVTSTIKFQLPRVHDKVVSIHLTALTIEESAQGLVHLCGHIRNFHEYVTELIECSAGFPIAVLLIGTVLKDGNMGPKELTKNLRQSWVETMKAEGQYHIVTHIKSIVKVCLEGLPFELRKNFSKLAFIPSSFSSQCAGFLTSSKSLTIEEGEFSNFKTAVVKHDILLPLHERSLVEVYHVLDPQSHQERFHIHDFIKGFIEDKYHLLDQDLKEVRNRYCVFYGKLLMKITPLLELNYTAHLPTFTIEIRNVEKLLREAVYCVRENIDLFVDVAYRSHYLIETFLPTEDAVHFYKACLNTTQNKEKPGRVNKMAEARMMIMYGKMLGAAKTDFELEHEQYMQAMSILKPYGDTWEMVTLLYCLAENIHCRGTDRKVAIRYLHDALSTLNRMVFPSITKKTERKSRYDVRRERDQQTSSELEIFVKKSRADTTYMLGKIHAWIGETQHGETYHFESLAIKRQLWGDDHPSVGDSYNALSLLYEKAGNVEKAAKFCFLGLHIKQKHLKEPTNAMITSLNNAARHFSRQHGDHQRAIELLNKAYKMREKLGLDHRDTSLIFNNRGKVFSWKGDWENAMLNFKMSVRLRYKYLGAHASTASALYLLGKCYLKLSRYDQALDYLQKSLDMLEEVHMKEQPESPERASTLETIAEAHLGQHNQEKAMEFGYKTLSELERLAERYWQRGQAAKHIEFDKRITDVKHKFKLLKI